LELDFLTVVRSFMLDGKFRPDRHMDSFAANLYFESFSALDGIRKTPQLGGKLGVCVAPFDIPLGFGAHFTLLSIVNGPAGIASDR
jgi:hypothetical protein